MIFAHPKNKNTGNTNLKSFFYDVFPNTDK